MMFSRTAILFSGKSKMPLRSICAGFEWLRGNLILYRLEKTPIYIPQEIFHHDIQSMYIKRIFYLITRPSGKLYNENSLFHHYEVYRLESSSRVIIKPSFKD